MRPNGQAINEHTQEALVWKSLKKNTYIANCLFYFYVLLTRGISALLIQMAFKNFTTQVVEGTLQMIEDEMFVEVFDM